MKNLNLTVGEWRTQEPGYTSERYIFVHHHNKKDGLFLRDFGKELECSLLKDAAVIYALETVMTAVTWKRGLSVKVLKLGCYTRGHDVSCLVKKALQKTFKRRLHRH